MLILLFLGSWRSTIVVVTSIPLAILFSIMMLSAMGHSLNLMTLGGLALAVGILVDDATVTIENIHRHLAMGKDLRQAILDGSQQIVVPALVSMLCICIVFLPVLLLTGAARYLFTPMALAVVFAVVASYLLSRTLVPVMARYLLQEGDACCARRARGFRPPARGFEARFEALRSRYLGALRWALSVPKTVFALFGRTGGGTAGGGQLHRLGLLPGRSTPARSVCTSMPRSARASKKPGAIFTAVQDEIRSVIDAEDLDVIIDNIGIPPSTNLAYSDNVTITSSDGEILVSLKPDHRSRNQGLCTRACAQVLPEKFPEVRLLLPARRHDEPDPQLRTAGADRRQDHRWRLQELPSGQGDRGGACARFPVRWTCTCTRS